MPKKAQTTIRIENRIEALEKARNQRIKNHEGLVKDIEKIDLLIMELTALLKEDDNGQQEQTTQGSQEEVQ